MGLAFLSGAKRNRSLLFFLEEKKQKKINCGTVILCRSRRFCRRATQNGRFTYEPSVFRSESNVRKSVFSQIDRLSRSVFCFFSSRKEIVPLLFFLEEKTVSLRGKRRPSDGRTQAHPALSSVGIPQRVCLPPPPCLCPCPPRLRACFPVQADHAKENQLRNSHSLSLPPFLPTCNTKRTVHIRTVRFPFRIECAEKRLFSD